MAAPRRLAAIESGACMCELVVVPGADGADGAGLCGGAESIVSRHGAKNTAGVQYFTFTFLVPRVSFLVLVNILIDGHARPARAAERSMDTTVYKLYEYAPSCKPRARSCPPTSSAHAKATGK